MATAGRLPRNPFTWLYRDRGVVAATNQLGDALRADGFLVGRGARRAMRLATVPILVVLALGCVRWLAGHANDARTDYLASIIVTLALIEAWLLIRVRRRSRRGDRAFKALRRQYRHLAPRSRPAWNMYGPSGVAMSVALFGGAAIWAADPAFAAEAELMNSYIHDNGATVSRGSSSDSGSSTSCSGGSGCGGGGGGGGCGG